MYTVRVGKPDPRFGNMPLEQSEYVADGVFFRISRKFVFGLKPVIKITAFRSARRLPDLTRTIGNLLFVW